MDLDSNSNSRLSMNVLPGYTDFNITNHNQKMINADYNFENYLLSHSSTHDYKSSRMQPTVKKVKTNKVLKTSKSAVPSHLVSTSSAKNRTKAHNQNSSFQNHNNTNQNINSSSSSNHVTVNRATAAHTHSSHTDSKSANVQRTKISNETNTYENTHPHTHKDRDRDRDTHTATNKDRDRIDVRAPGTGTQIPSLTRYDEQVRHSLLTLGLDPGPYTESYSPPVSARAYPGVHAVVRESPRRPRSAPPSASRPPTSTPASPSPPASPHAHAPYLHKTLRSASAEARRPSTLDSRGGIATLGKNERTRREPSAVRNIPKNVLPDRNGSQGQSARKDSYTTLDLYPFSSPGRGRSGRPPVAPHPSLSASHTSPHHSPQHSSPHHSRTMPYSTARVMGVRAPSFSATHMSATPSPSSHSYSRI